MRVGKETVLMAEERVQRRLAAILAADVVGYSRLVEADEEGTVARLKSLQTELIHPMIAKDGGRVVKVMGDGVLVEFGSAVDAVRNALAIQTELESRNADLQRAERIEFRVGINVGDVIIDGDDIQGDGVNIAARLEGLCEAGQVFVSRAVRDQVEGKLAAAFDDLGEQTVKNMARPVRVYRARAQREGDAEPNGSPGALPLPDKPSIAVLPFDNMSGDPEQEYFSDGITEDIITALSRVRLFFVIARNSTFQYKGASPDIRQVGSDLGVRYVLEGSVRKAGERIRITAQLIDGATGNHLWAERYDRDLADVFAVQDEITQTVVGAIAPAMETAELRRAHAKQPEDMRAWDYLLRGREQYSRGTRESVVEAIALLKRSIEIDPNFAPAYAALGMSYGRSLTLAYLDDLDKAGEKGIEAAEKAIELDRSDAEAHTALGFLRWARGEIDDAISILQTAVALNPNSVSANAALGLALGSSERAEEGIQYLRIAMRLSPRDSDLGIIMGRMGFTCFNARRYEEAVEWANRSIRETKGQIWLPICEGLAALGHLGRSDEAHAMLTRLTDIRPDASIALVRRTRPFSSPAVADHFLDGLRKAGLPEG
jgi:adenylate cyclase